MPTVDSWKQETPNEVFQEEAVPIAPGLPAAIVRAVPIAAVGALTVALAGCAMGGPLNSEHQSQEYAEQVTLVEIRLDSGDVTLSPSAADTVSVSRRLQWRTSKPVVTETFDAGTMRISVSCANRIGTCEVDYGLKVPAAASVRCTRTRATSRSLTSQVVPRWTPTLVTSRWTALAASYAWSRTRARSERTGSCRVMYR